jgi:hypothetical protein
MIAQRARMAGAPEAAPPFRYNSRQLRIGRDLIFGKEIANGCADNEFLTDRES